MAQQSIILTQIASDFASPVQYTVAAPTVVRYRMTSTIIEFGDSTYVNPTTGQTAAGFVNVAYRRNNGWVTGNVYVTINGAAIKALIEA